MTDKTEATRLYLITPLRPDPEAFPSLLREALGSGDVAAVLIATAANADLEALGARLVPIIQDAGAAALVADDTRVTGRLGADGVHVGTGLGDLRAAKDSFSGKRIVGAGNIHSRHAAMEAGEIGADYILFGRPHGDTHDEPHPKALDLADWWSDLMEIPGVLMGGRSLRSLPEAAASGAAFIALHEAIWAHPDGPGAAVREASAMLDALGPPAS